MDSQLPAVLWREAPGHPEVHGQADGQLEELAAGASWIRALGCSQGSSAGAEGEAEIYSACSLAVSGAGASNFPALGDGARNHQVPRKGRDPPIQVLIGMLSH